MLNLCCDLLEDIKADVKQQMSKFLPGIHTNSMSGIVVLLSGIPCAVGIHIYIIYIYIIYIYI